MATFKKSFIELNDHILNLEKDISDVEKYTATVERNSFRLFSALEYRIWQYNTTANLMFYEQLLTKKVKKRNFHPLVSIIIPVFNGSNYLSKAIQAALNQNYDNIEVIVVNDGSTDNGKTEKAAKAFGNKIHYIEKPNGGVSSALNYGIKKMKGEYFAWLSHDDLITNDHIEKLVEWVSFKGTDHDIPFSCFDLIDENGHILFEETIRAQLFCSDFKVSYYYDELGLLQGEINGGSVLIPKKAFNELGLFDESQKITQERDMWSRLIAKYHFINIPYCTSSIRLHKAQVTNTNNDIIEKTNQKNLSIIKSLTNDHTVTTFDNEIVLLEHLKRSFSDNNKTWLFDEVSKIIQSKKSKD